MKIALIIDSLSLGGAQKHLVTLAVGFAKRGHDVRVWVLNDLVDNSYRQKLDQASIPICVLGLKSVVSGGALLRLCWQWSFWRPDVCVPVLFYSTLMVRVACLGLRLCLVELLQAKNIDYNGFKRTVLILSARVTQLVISNSRSAIAWSRRHEGNSQIAVAFAPNFQGGAGCEGTGAASWSELGLSLPSCRVAISFGRLNTQKGYDLLLEALGRIDANSLKRTRVLVFGDGPERAKLENQCARLGLSEVCRFIPARADAARFLPLADLYLQPSRWEGTPNAVGEAMAAGLPVVAFSVDGIFELASEYGGITLVPIGDSSALAQELAAFAAGKNYTRPRPVSVNSELVLNSHETLMVDALRRFGRDIKKA